MNVVMWQCSSKKKTIFLLLYLVTLTYSRSFRYFYNLNKFNIFGWGTFFRNVSLTLTSWWDIFSDKSAFRWSDQDYFEVMQNCSLCDIFVQSFSYCWIMNSEGCSAVWCSGLSDVPFGEKAAAPLHRTFRTAHWKAQDWSCSSSRCHVGTSAGPDWIKTFITTLIPAWL